MTDPSARNQFHTAIYGHAPGTCDTVRASGVFARNGRRPVTAGTHTPTLATSAHRRDL